MAAWNPSKKSMEELYEESMGCTEAGIAPCCAEDQPMDVLHAELNLASHYVKAAVTILAVAHKGDKENSKDLKWRQTAKTSVQFKDAKIKLDQHMKKSFGVTRKISNKVQNPGWVARTVLSKEKREDMFSILPESKPKAELLKSLSLLDPLRDVWYDIEPSLEAKRSYKTKALEWHNHRKNQLPWISATNVCHQVIHILLNSLTLF